MSTFDKLHQDQDDFIKKSFQEDKVISHPALEDFTSYIEKSNIRVRRYTYKQKKLISVLLILLIISLGFNALFLSGNYSKIPLIASILPTHKSEFVEPEKTLNTENKQEEPEKEVKNTVKEDIISNSNTTNSSNTTTVIVSDSKNNSVQNSTIVATLDSPTTVSIDDINIKNLKSVLENYSYGIERIKDDDETLETNTILLIIAKKYFDSTSPNKIAKEDKAKFIPLAANMHAYIEELTGFDFSDKDYIQSYNNYIGYVQNSKSYNYGNDASKITSEKYSCSELKILEQNGNTFTAEAVVSRTIDKEVTNYDVSFTFKVNKDYTYQPYCITSLKSSNTSFYPDNTIHFVDITAQEEKDGNKR